MQKQYLTYLFVSLDTLDAMPHLMQLQLVDSSDDGNVQNVSVSRQMGTGDGGLRSVGAEKAGTSSVTIDPRVMRGETSDADDGMMEVVNEGL